MWDGDDECNDDGDDDCNDECAWYNLSGYNSAAVELEQIHTVLHLET